MKLFGEQHITQIFRQNVERMRGRVNSMTDSRLLSQEKTAIVNEIFNMFEEQGIEIDFTNRDVDIRLADRLGRSFPPGTDLAPNEILSVAEVTYTFINKSESTKFLNATPTRRVLQHVVKARIDGINIRIPYLTRYAQIELNDAVKKEVKDWISGLIPQLESTVVSINDEIVAYNDEMRIQIDKLVSEKIEAAKRKQDTKDSLADF